MFACESYLYRFRLRPGVEQQANDLLLAAFRRPMQGRPSLGIDRVLIFRLPMEQFLYAVLVAKNCRLKNVRLSALCKEEVAHRVPATLEGVSQRRLVGSIQSVPVRFSSQQHFH